LGIRTENRSLKCGSLDLKWQQNPNAAERDEAAMKRDKTLTFDPKVFLTKVNGGRTISKFRTDQVVYEQGAPAVSVF